MIVLGVNGWDDGTHDPAAALLVDGQVAAFVEEERINRRKHAISDLPHLALRAALAEADVRFEEVDVVAYGWDLPAYYGQAGRSWRYTDETFLREVTGVSAGRMPRLVWVPHHEAHAASAYLGSGMDPATVVVVDGQGEEESISLYHGRRGALELLRTWPPACSLGLLYQAATTHCGFGFLEAGKTMGLAPYGSESEDPMPLHWEGGDLRSPIDGTLEEFEVLEAWGEYLTRRFGARASPPKRFDRLSLRYRADGDDPAAFRPAIAAAAQHTVDGALRALVADAVGQTGCRDVVLAGGVALNCVANGKLLDVCDRLFVQPAAHDAGVALGAAMKVAAECGERIAPLTTVALGPAYSSERSGRFLAACRLPARRVDDPAEEAEKRLLRGEVIGWFQGAMEAGPRALGHRSILALPHELRVWRQVNRLKGREAWRPLAPSLLREEMPTIFGRDINSPYMLISYPLTPAGRAIGPAIAHVDGSARMQTVDPGPGPFRRLLERIRASCGTGMVLNTSFNGPGEPIVATPADAVRSFMTMGLDALLLEDWLVIKVGSDDRAHS